MKTRIKILFFCLSAAAVIIGAVYFPLNLWLHRFLEWVRGRGALGMIVYGMAYALGTVLFVPGTALTLGSGLLFGVLRGTLLVSLASVTGATLAFLIARYVGREWTLRRIERYPKFVLIDRAIGESGFKLVLLMRLQPVFLPFAILNYALGLTRVRLRDYVLASWIGMLPATTLYVYVGSSLKSISDLVQGKVPAADHWHQLLFWGGLVLSAVLVTIFTRIAKQALQTRLGPEEQTLAKETE